MALDKIIENLESLLELNDNKKNTDTEVKKPINNENANIDDPRFEKNQDRFYRNTVDIDKDLSNLLNRLPDFSEVIEYLKNYIDISSRRNDKKYKFPDFILICDDYYYIDFFVSELGKIICKNDIAYIREDYKNQGYKYFVEDLKKYAENQIINMDVIDAILIKKTDDKISKSSNTLELFIDYIESINPNSYNMIYTIDFNNLKENIHNINNFHNLEDDLKNYKNNTLSSLLKTNINLNKNLPPKDKKLLENLSDNMFNDKKIFIIKKQNITNLVNEIYYNSCSKIFNLNMEIAPITSKESEYLNICFDSIEDIIKQIKQQLKNKHVEFDQKYELITSNVIEQIINKNNKECMPKFSILLEKLNLHKEETNYTDLISQLISNLNLINLYNLKKMDLTINLPTLIKNDLEKNQDSIKSLIKNKINENYLISKEKQIKLIHNNNPKLNKILEINEKSILPSFILEQLSDAFFDWIMKNDLKIFDINLSKYYQIQEIQNEQEEKDLNYHLIKVLDKTEINNENNYTDNNLVKKIAKKINNEDDFKKIKLISNDFALKIKQLREEFPNFNNYIDFIEQELSIKNITTKEFLLSPSLLVGSAGVGKTYFVKKLAECFDVKYYNFSLNTVDSVGTITGWDSTWESSKPGMIFDNFFYNESINNIILLDELDKAVNKSSTHLSVQGALLTLLEKETAKEYRDQFINVKMNVNYVNFIATANEIEAVSAPLKSRLRIFEIPNPNEHQRRIICQNIYKNILKDYELSEKFTVNLLPEVLEEFMKKEISNRELKNIIYNCIGKTVIDQTKKDDLFEITQKCASINIQKSNENKNIGFI